MSKNFKKDSVFLSKRFENRLDTIEKRLGKRARKQVEADESEKYLLEVDKPTGPEYVAQEETKKLKEAKDQKDEIANYLDMSHGFSSYRANLAEWGMWTLMQKDFPPGFEYHCIPTKSGPLNIYGKNFTAKDGILFVLKAPSGKVYAKAVTCSYMPEVDVKAVGLLAVEVENTVDSLKGILLSDKKIKIEKPSTKIIIK